MIRTLLVGRGTEVNETDEVSGLTEFILYCGGQKQTENTVT